MNDALARMANEKRRGGGKCRCGDVLDQTSALVHDLHSKDSELQYVWAENVALRSLLRGLTQELREEEQTMEDLYGDLSGFMRDINMLERKKKLLLTMEHGVLVNNTTRIQSFLQEQKQTLRLQQEAAAAEQKQTSIRLLVQKERTNKSLNDSNNTAALLYPLKKKKEPQKLGLSGALQAVFFFI
ncbi:hypothetical protein TraAM80_01702 [Trypanosoma rangeli]|uniref:Uncharacterized protein n=1 Tax=Trypanosoma rangeli TaxID=5698 RepID=A0A422NXS9_TRYRA|nr:uncharacterized protein TraAM80_01702 [Trypanosoma rangeli]RNF10342.1 hypothetical protein TraAM80_01702 [Trypanosoma rangeli]|eukprot:RNF10342.1 hypothetical protein TraAM80_01702 [Trypanosoma rangeli]